MFRRILVLLDDGLVGRRIVPWVRRLLAPVGGDVHLLAVLAPGQTVIAGSRPLSYANQSEDAARGAASVALAAVAARLRDDGFAVSSFFFSSRRRHTRSVSGIPAEPLFRSMRSNLWASGYDVDGTDQTSLG